MSPLALLLEVWLCLMFPEVSFDVYYLSLLSLNSTVGAAMKEGSVGQERKLGPGGPALSVYMSLPLEEVSFRWLSCLGPYPSLCQGAQTSSSRSLLLE